MNGTFASVAEVRHETARRWKEETGKKVFLLAQSFMPAQDIHLLINRREPNISPWYNLEFGDFLDTPEWRFDNHDLMRFR